MGTSEQSTNERVNSAEGKIGRICRERYMHQDGNKRTTFSASVLGTKDRTLVSIFALEHHPNPEAQNASEIAQAFLSDLADTATAKGYTATVERSTLITSLDGLEAAIRELDTRVARVGVPSENGAARNGGKTPNYR